MWRLQPSRSRSGTNMAAWWATIQRNGPASRRGLLDAEGEHRDVDVGVGVLVVGVRVVGVVLGDPGVVAHADQAAVQVAEDVVGAPAREDLAMARVVPDESELRRDQAEEDRGEQLPPRGPERHEDGDRRCCEHRVQREHEGVGATAAPQQPGLLDLEGEVGERRRRGGSAGEDLAHESAGVRGSLMALLRTEGRGPAREGTAREGGPEAGRVRGRAQPRSVDQRMRTESACMPF